MMLKLILEFVIPAITGVLVGYRMLKLRHLRPREGVNMKGEHACYQNARIKKYNNKLWFCWGCEKIWRGEYDGWIEVWRWKEFTGDVYAYPHVSLLFLYCGTHDKEAVGCQGCLDHHLISLRCGLLPNHVFHSCDICRGLWPSPAVEGRPSLTAKDWLLRHYSNPVGGQAGDTAEHDCILPLRTYAEPEAPITTTKHWREFHWYDPTEEIR